MKSVDPARFPAARENESLLNDRQREILDLLVAGKTNGEIAERCGITLDGAKWNVSEILTKLGLATREEAAEYWRWRRGLRMRWASLLRRMAGSVPLKWVAGTGAAALGVVALVAVTMERETGSPGESFYLEATIEVVDRSRAVGTSIDGAPNLDFDETTLTTMRWWQKDRDNMRIEMDVEEPTASDSTTIVMDGDDQWVYRSNANTYTKSPLPPLPDEVKSRYPSISILLGPSPLATRDALVKQLQEWATPRSVESRGTATVLGMECERLAFGPARTSSTGGSGEMEICLHEPTMVILRYLVTDTVQDVHAELTRYDPGAPIDDDLLAFEPPDGAVETRGNDGDSYSVSGTGDRRTPPPGFLAITYLPEGFGAPFEEITSSGRGVVTDHEVRFRHAVNGATLYIGQSLAPRGIGNRPAAAETVDINGAEAWMVGRLTDEPTLVMWREGIRITLRSTGFESGELLRIAAGLEMR